MDPQKKALYNENRRKAWAYKKSQSEPKYSFRYYGDDDDEKNDKKRQKRATSRAGQEFHNDSKENPTSSTNTQGPKRFTIEELEMSEVLIEQEAQQLLSEMFQPNSPACKGVADSVNVSKSITRQHPSNIERTKSVGRNSEECCESLSLESISTSRPTLLSPDRIPASTKLKSMVSKEAALFEESVSTQYKNELEKEMHFIESEAGKLLFEFSQLNSTSEPENVEGEKKLSKSDWENRILRRNSDWNAIRENFKVNFVEKQCNQFEMCTHCCEATSGSPVISCKTCKQELCPGCDMKFHSKAPFHQRLLTSFSSSSITARKLLPTEFVDNSSGAIREIGVPVPCFVFPVCRKCFKKGTCELIPGKERKIVVTKDGRFDLNSAELVCTSCNYCELMTESEYIKSHWWPGSPSNSSYLFSEDLLEFWYHLNHQNSGLSETKFLETLNQISMSNNRCGVINRSTFNKASREYEFLVHNLDKSIRRQQKTSCPACGDNPCAACIDGNFRLVRLESASKGPNESLLKSEMIASRQEVNEYISSIDGVIAPERNNPCGGNRFKAAKETSSKKKNLDETGIMMSCCRHLIILKAVNMEVGESYRHAHFLHNFLFSKGYSILCYDIVCLYWKWAEKVSRLMPQFSGLTRKMIPFLSRFHALAHVWHCYVRWVGHWKTGVGATVGEEQEQVNAFMTPYANVTCHMGSGNRNDTLSAGMMYHNSLQMTLMPEFLSKRMNRAFILQEEFRIQLEHLLKKRNGAVDLQTLVNQIVQKAVECSEKDIDDTRDGPPSFLMKELETIHSEIQIFLQRKNKQTATQKERNTILDLLRKSKKKAEEIIEEINQWHWRNSGGESTSSKTILTPLITIEDFNKGFFPWQLQKDSYVEDKYLIETWMLSLRYEEEIIIVANEMTSFLRSIKKIKSTLENDLSNCFATIRAISQNGGPHLQYLKGKSCLVQQEIIRLSNLLIKAVHLFRPMIEILESSQIN